MFVKNYMEHIKHCYENDLKVMEEDELSACDFEF